MKQLLDRNNTRNKYKALKNATRLKVFSYIFLNLQGPVKIGYENVYNNFLYLNQIVFSL